jgi:hypothetical protein
VSPHPPTTLLAKARVSSNHPAAYSGGRENSESRRVRAEGRVIREGVSMRGSMVRIRYKYEVANIGFHALRDITQLEDSAVKG